MEKKKKDKDRKQCENNRSMGETANANRIFLSHFSIENFTYTFTNCTTILQHMRESHAKSNYNNKYKINRRIGFEIVSGIYIYIHIDIVILHMPHEYGVFGRPPMYESIKYALLC